MVDNDDDEEVIVPSKACNSKHRKVESEEPVSVPECPAPYWITRQAVSSSQDVRHIFFFIMWLSYSSVHLEFWRHIWHARAQ